MSASNHAWVLMARCLYGDATPAEQAELETLLAGDAVLRQQYNLLRHNRDNAQPEAQLPPSGYLPQVARILQLARVEELMSAGAESKMATVQRKPFAVRAVSLVLALLLLGGLAYVVVPFSKQATVTLAKQPPHVLVTQKGSRSRSLLPDGSTVWLNAGTSITYAEDFEGTAREVELQGEAFFDVVKNPRKPFLVHAAGITIQVLGTAFNVKSYAADSTVETTLIGGLVAVTISQRSLQTPVYLHPNEKLVVRKAAMRTIAVQPPVAGIVQDTAIAGRLKTFSLTRLEGKQGAVGGEALVETAWLYNRLAFRGDRFETLAPKLERWYNIDIQFTDEAVKDLQFNGSFEKETMEQAFRALAAAASFRYVIKGHQVMVSAAAR